MRVSVKLDDQAGRAGREIGNVRGQHDLPLKFHAQAIRPQHGPQLLLGSRHAGAQRFRPVPRDLVAFHQSPSPNPLPLKGERALAQ
jgi:hypothetical protein